MVIDKLNQHENKSGLIAPLLGYKDNELFIQIKKEYGLFLLHVGKTKEYVNPLLINSDVDKTGVGVADSHIKDHIYQTKSRLLTLKKLIEEFFNYCKDEKDSQLKELKDIFKNIKEEHKSLLVNIKKIYDNNFISEEINSAIDLNEVILKEINHKYFKKKNEKAPDGSSKNHYHFSEEKKFSNAVLVKSGNCVYTVEDTEIWTLNTKIVLISLVLFFVIFLYWTFFK